MPGILQLNMIMTEKPIHYSSAVIEENLVNAQSHLSEREHQLRVLTDHLPGHIAYVGVDDLCYRFVNQKFESSFGLPREEIIGKHIKKIIGESNYDYALKYIAEVRAGKSTSYLNVFNLAQGRRWAIGPIPRNTNVFLRLKFLPSLKLNKIERISTTSYHSKKERPFSFPRSSVGMHPGTLQRPRPRKTGHDRTLERPIRHSYAGA